MDKSNRILIIGAGTFGLSTAYHLAKSGYSNITVLEKSRTTPPAQSAANDLNKIIRAEYEDPFYTQLALSAIHQWQTNPLFSPHYHQVGYLLATSPAAPQKAKDTLQRSLRSIIEHPAWKGQVKPLNTRSDISSVAPAFAGEMNWKGYMNNLAGYAHSGDSVKALHEACLDIGVKIHISAPVTRLLYDSTGSKCIGALTASGEEYHASTVIMAVGAAIATLLPALAPQVQAVAFPVAHIQLTAEEAKPLRGIPVTYARDLGFFFEPDHTTNLLKICNAGAGYTHFVDSSSTLSVPPESLRDSALITPEDEKKMRELLRQTLPSLAERELIDKRVCWCADSGDTEYIIDFVPGIKNLVVCSGDSGHGFKMMPIFGEWVVELLEKGGQREKRWKWKEVEDGAKDVSWRVGTKKDLNEVKPVEAKL